MQTKQDDAEEKPEQTQEGKALSVRVRLTPDTLKGGLSIELDENGEPKRSRYVWDNLTDSIRHHSPAFLVNHSSRITGALSLIGNLLSIYSARRFYKNGALTTGAMLDSIMCVNSMLFNEQPQTPEELEHYDEMNTLEYIPHRLGESLQFWHYPTRARALVQMGSGLLQLKGGMESGGKSLQAKGALGTAGAAILNLTPEQERAWQLSVPLYLARAACSAENAFRAYTHGFPKKGTPRGNWAEPAKWGINILGNQIIPFFYGGVYKDEDGNIHKDTGRMSRRFQEELERTDSPLDLAADAKLAHIGADAAPQARVQTQGARGEPLQPAPEKAAAAG